MLCLQKFGAAVQQCLTKGSAAVPKHIMPRNAFSSKFKKSSASRRLRVARWCIVLSFLALVMACYFMAWSTLSRGSPDTPKRAAVEDAEDVAAKLPWESGTTAAPQRAPTLPREKEVNAAAQGARGEQAGRLAPEEQHVERKAEQTARPASGAEGEKELVRLALAGAFTVELYETSECSGRRITTSPKDLQSSCESCIDTCLLKWDDGTDAHGSVKSLRAVSKGHVWPAHWNISTFDVCLGDFGFNANRRELMSGITPASGCVAVERLAHIQWLGVPKKIGRLRPGQVDRMAPNIVHFKGSTQVYPDEYQVHPPKDDKWRRNDSSLVVMIAALREERCPQTL